MRMTECEMVREVVSKVGAEKVDEVVFDNLKCLELNCLPGLGCFSSGGYDFKFPALDNVIVIGCPKMKLFSRGDLWTPKLQRIQVTLEERGESCWKEDLNTTMEHLFEEMVSFSFTNIISLRKCRGLNPTR